MRKIIYMGNLNPLNYLEKILLNKNMLIILLTVSLFQLSAKSFSQNPIVNLKKSELTFKEVIQSIEEQTEFKVFYKNGQIDLNRSVYIEEKSGTISSILKASLKGTEIIHTMLDKVIVLSLKEDSSTKKGPVVSGVVSDKNDEPIPGVNINEKGTLNGAVTDINGNFSIRLTGDDPTIVFSFIGLVSKEVVVGDLTTINVTLAESLVDLDEVVVVGYGTAKKSDITGAVTSIRAEDLEQGTSNNPMEAMQGKAAGVDITSNARPGEMGTIRIRGERSITGGNDPLYVVDGIPMAQSMRTLNITPRQVGASLVYEQLGHNPIAHLNPNDIESIEILKDASATAIYGSRAANGVVLITTKRGESGNAKVTYDFSYSIDQLDDRIEMFDAHGLLESYREGIRNKSSKKYPVPYADPQYDLDISYLSQDPYAWMEVAKAYEWEDQSSEDPSEWKVAMRPTTDAERSMWGEDITEIPVYDPEKIGGTDWMDYATQTGLTQNHQIGVSMGDERFNTYLSFGYLDKMGIEKGQNYNRYTAMVTMDAMVTNRIKVGGSLNGMFSDQDYGINTIGRARGMLPFTAAYDPDGNYILIPGGDDHMSNFIKDVDEALDNRTTYHMRGSFYGEIDLFEGLKFRTNFGPDFRSYRQGRFESAETSSRYDADGGTSYARYFQDQTFNWILENLLYYNTTISDQHNFGVTFLHSAEQYNYEYSHLSALNLTTNNQLWYNLGSTREGVADDFGTNFEKETRESYMARINLGLYDKYMITASGRWDGASVLAPGNKWAFFPSCALAWKMQNEPFLSSIKMITESKLRIGYGVTGNSAIGPYQATGSLRNLNYNFGSTVATGVAINRPSNYDLGWEKTAQINFGYDFAILEGRISGSIDAYQSKTSDLLLDKLIPVVNGADNVTDNVGVILNKGLELSISTINISTKDFRWRTQFTFSKNKNEIVELLDDENDLKDNLWFIGQPIQVYRDYEYDGLWQMTSADSTLFEEHFTGRYSPGSIKVMDNDTTGGEYVINDFDKVIIGTRYPKFIAGMTNFFTYKGWELSVFVFARVGQTIGKATPNLQTRYVDVAVDYWTPYNTEAIYPRPSNTRDPYMGSLGYQDGSFLKIRNVSLKYEIPSNILSKINVARMSLNAQLLNPVLITKAKYTDPDYGTPNAIKSVVFGINVGF